MTAADLRRLMVCTLDAEAIAASERNERATLLRLAYLVRRGLLRRVGIHPA